MKKYIDYDGTDEDKDLIIEQEKEEKYVFVGLHNSDVQKFLVFESFSELLLTIRIRKNTLLLDSDWTQLQDVPLTEDKKNEWKVYRQTLRDILNTITIDNPQPVWPVKPTE
jgi:hypothetical protein